MQLGGSRGKAESLWGFSRRARRLEFGLTRRQRRLPRDEGVAGTRKNISTAIHRISTPARGFATSSSIFEVRGQVRCEEISIRAPRSHPRLDRQRWYGAFRCPGQELVVATFDLSRRIDVFSLRLLSRPVAVEARRRATKREGLGPHVSSLSRCPFRDTLGALRKDRLGL